MKFLALATICGVTTAAVSDRVKMLQAIDQELNELEFAAAELDDDSDDEDEYTFRQGYYTASASHTLAGKCHLIPYDHVNSVEVKSVYGDQGWGNKNARFNLCLVRSGKPLACQDIFGAYDRSLRKVQRERTHTNVPITTQA